MGYFTISNEQMHYLDTYNVFFSYLGSMDDCCNSCRLQRYAQSITNAAALCRHGAWWKLAKLHFPRIDSSLKAYHSSFFVVSPFFQSRLFFAKQKLMLVYLTKHEVVNEKLNTTSECKNLPLLHITIKLLGIITRSCKSVF